MIRVPIGISWYKGRTYAIKESLNNSYCGYVKLVTEKELQNLMTEDHVNTYIDMHGGCTYRGSLEEMGDTGTWIGFDTLHCFDGPDTQNFIYCLEECKRIIEQLLKYNKEEIKE